MIRKATITAFKSLAQVDLNLGRINVFIGENGAGKSNLLEALAFGAAASTRQLSHEFLATRGVRSVAPELMHCAFPGAPTQITIQVCNDTGADAQTLRLNWASSHWVGQALSEGDADRMAEILAAMVPTRAHDEIVKMLAEAPDSAPREDRLRTLGMSTFLAYSPEYSALRTFQDETQILPLGVRGEGLFAHLKQLANLPTPAAFNEIIAQMNLFDWFEGLAMPSDLAPGERRLRIRDRYLTDQTAFDQRSANEGFLFLLFYFTLDLGTRRH